MNFYDLNRRDLMLWVLSLDFSHMLRELFINL